MTRVARLCATLMAALSALPLAAQDAPIEADLPLMETPPPPEAGNGPPRAADAIWGAQAMHASRAELVASHGDFPTLWVQADRMEVRAGSGADGYLWDVQGYYGGPTQKLWIKSEGEGAFTGDVAQADLQALWSRAISPYWDLQLGVRQDLVGAAASHAVLGLHGLAPYLIEVDAALFLSHKGDLTGRIKAELDQRITQRLILQPRVELKLAAQAGPDPHDAAGLNKADLGLRLRYEIRRELAPYIGIEQGWHTKRSSAAAPAVNATKADTRLVAGVRFWF